MCLTVLAWFVGVVLLGTQLPGSQHSDGLPLHALHRVTMLLVIFYGGGYIAAKFGFGPGADEESPKPRRSWGLDVYRARPDSSPDPARERPSPDHGTPDLEMVLPHGDTVVLDTIAG
jgi:hypothetical protein